MVVFYGLFTSSIHTAVEVKPELGCMDPGLVNGKYLTVLFNVMFCAFGCVPPPDVTLALT